MAVGEVTSKLSERNNRENGHRVAENIYIPINKNYIFFLKKNLTACGLSGKPIHVAAEVGVLGGRGIVLSQGLTTTRKTFHVFQQNKTKYI